MAMHSSILDWRIPRTEEPGRLQSMGLQSQTRLSTHTRTSKLCHLRVTGTLDYSQVRQKGGDLGPQLASEVKAVVWLSLSP